MRNPQEQRERNAMIVTLLQSDSTLSYAEIQERIKDKLGLTCAASTIITQKRKLGLPVKVIVKSPKRKKQQAAVALQHPIALPQKDPLEDDLLRVLRRMRATKIARITLTDAGEVHLERQESFHIT